MPLPVKWFILDGHKEKRLEKTSMLKQKVNNKIGIYQDEERKSAVTKDYHQNYVRQG